MVLVDAPSCFWFKMNVPSGMHVLAANWGKHHGLYGEGWHICVPFWKTIPVMITRNTVRFKCPVQFVPTRDNVLVTLDVGINFHIGRSDATFEEDARKFFYNFGPNRLEELLSEECDEGVRSFVKQTKVSKIRDVKTELTIGLQSALNEKFNIYGVVIEQVNIMNVILPRDLRVALMAPTSYDVYLQKQVKH